MGLRQKKTYDAITYNAKTGCGTINVICTHKNGKLRHVAIQLAQPGVCANTAMSSLAAMINQMIVAVRDNLKIYAELNKHHNDEDKKRIKPLGVGYIIKALEGQSCNKKPCCYDIVAKLLTQWKDEYEKIY